MNPPCMSCGGARADTARPGCHTPAEHPDQCPVRGSSDVGYCQCIKPANHPPGAHACTHGPW